MTLIAVVSAKGGQGKSTLSNAIALACGGAIVTNEKHSSMDKIVKGFAKVDSEADLPPINSKAKVIFDAKAGIHERVVEQAIQQADFVLVPIKPESPEELRRLAWGLSEVPKIQPSAKVAVVVMKARKDEFEAIKKQILSKWSVPVFWMPNSVYLHELGDERFGGESLHEKAKAGGLKAYNLRKVIREFETLMAHIQLPISR